MVVPSDLEPAKMIGTSIFRPTIIAVEGSYDDVNRLCTELADCVDWGFCNLNLRPYYSEGSKTLTFETAQQLGMATPRRDHRTGRLRLPVRQAPQGAGELIDLGLVESASGLPRLTGPRCSGARRSPRPSPAAKPRVVPVRPATIARSIAIGNPSDGADVLRIARETGGVVESATEEELVEGIELLAASEGIFAETAGGSRSRCCASWRAPAAGRATKPWSPTSPGPG